MLPDEDGARHEIVRRYSADLAAMGALHDTVMEMASLGVWDVPRRGNDIVVVRTMALLLNKCLKTFRAIHVLAERGFVIQAQVLVRQLAEQALAVSFILQKHSKVRARIYHAYASSQMLKMIQHWTRTKGLKRRASVRTIQQAVTVLKHWTDQLPANTDYKSHWSGVQTLENVTRALKVEALYATLFRFTSRYTHGNETTEHIAFDASDPDGFAFTLTPSVTGIDGVSIGAREMLWFAAHTMDKKFRLGFSQQLEAHRVRSA